MAKEMNGENTEFQIEKQTAELVQILVVASALIYLTILTTGLLFHDWRLVVATMAGTVFLAVPYLFLKKGHLQASGFMLLLISLGTVTIIATIGQGIRDNAVMALPVILLYSGLGLKRKYFILCLIGSISSLCWLYFGELNGGFSSQDYHSYLQWNELVVPIILLAVTAYAIRLLIVYSRRNLELAQNELELRRQTELQLKRSEQRYRFILEYASEAILIVQDGYFKFVNPMAMKLSGYSEDELLEIPFINLIYQEDKQLVLDNYLNRIKGEPVDTRYTFRFLTKTNQLKWIELSSSSIDWNGSPATLNLAMDITERKRLEQSRAMTSEIMRLLNEAGDLKTILRRLIVVLKEYSGCEAIGIRLQEEDDYPYIVNEGFSVDFIALENSITERTIGDGVCRDSLGRTSLECTCGQVIAGSCTVESLFFTPYGSCWTNEDAVIPFIDTRNHARDRCLHSGYQSVALVPVKVKEVIVGLIQFNDRRKGFIAINMLQELELMSAQIGSALIRRQAEDRIKALLAEKELILKEVHHRIKNNMNTMISLLSLQAGNAVDTSAVLVLEDAKRRLESMTYLYEKLYQSSSYVELSINSYLSSLIDEILENFPESRNIKVEKNIQEFMLGVKYIQPIGIIINELLTNIMKHAFDGFEGALITITVQEIDRHVILHVYDNGRGFSKPMDLNKTAGFGLQLVHALADQLDGRFSVAQENGTNAIIEFNL
jgi:PAS domain S-box-containing protein